MNKVDTENHFTILKDGAPYHIKMSYGLLNELVRTLGDIEAFGEMCFDAELRNAVLVEIFSERDEMGVIAKPANLFTLDVEPEAVTELLAWVGAHVTDFLLSQMAKTKTVMEARRDKVAALTPISTGSPA